MNKQQTYKLLDDTFNHDFDVATFSKFLKELLNTSNLHQDDKTNYIRKEFREYIEKLIKIGQYKDSKGKTIEILAIKLTKHSSLERARTMQRNFIAKWLSNNPNEPDGAIVAFYDDTKDWRFSFVKLEYNLIKDKKSNLKAEKELTPAKRYSFLVGPNEPNHTCKKQFVDILINDKHNPLLEEIEKAFSIENVTKEFFENYKELYLELKTSLSKVVNNDNNVRLEFEKIIGKDKEALDKFYMEFSKKLLGQVVFLYFLQKKGWMGVQKNSSGRFEDWGTGPKDFMKRLFDKEYGDYKNFFNDILEPLFYNTLAIKRIDDYSDKFNCKIPFLNGGLFEPLENYNWMNTNICLDNSIFKSIFETFDEFNFTVKEDEPLDKEVAVDPEMLGKVFENLLKITDRKSKGAFYTPREIVHYMCQQSLINYLETNTKIDRNDIEIFIQGGDLVLDQTIRANAQKKRYNGKTDVDTKILPKSIENNYEQIDKLLQNIKVVDPAVGSGAFPIGMMNEIVKARSILSIFFENDRNIYDLKRHCIENNLYGVDIMPSAVDICQLRFWLSLIVDEVDKNKVKPLPNLDNKIMCGNSLLEEFEGVKLFDESLLGEEIKNIKHELDKIDNEIRELELKGGQITLGKYKGNIDNIKNSIKKLEKEKKKLTEVKKTDKNSNLMNFDKVQINKAKIKLNDLKAKQKEFFNEYDRDNKIELKKEIDNIEWELIEVTLKEQKNENALKKLENIKNSKSKPFFLWKLYFSEVFQRDNPGFDIVITNPPYVGHKGGQKDLFQELKNTEFGRRFNNERMDLFYYFFHLSIDKVRKGGDIAFITTNYYLTADSAIKLRTDFKNRTIVKKLINFNEFKIFETAKGQHNIITLLSKEHKESKSVKTAFCNRLGLANSTILKSILDESDTKTEYCSFLQKYLFQGKYLDMILADSKSNPFMHIIDKLIICKKLSYFCNINQGIVTGADKLTKKQLIKQKLDIKQGAGIFILNKKEIEKLNLNDDEKSILLPIYKNSDILKYWTNKDKYQKVIQLSTDINLNDYPNLLKHIIKFEKVIKNRNYESGELSKAKKLGTWWALSSSRREYDFSQEKIVVPYRNKFNLFAYNNKLWSATSDVFFITLKKYNNLKLKYILSILNSKLIYLWLYFKGKRKGNILELTAKPLSEIPIKEVSPEKQKPFIELVNRILSTTEDKDYLDNPDKQAKVKLLEKEIDTLVYKLYNLTPKDIKIIKNFNKKK
jgi:adenine-specific DNA-methyltransferase